MSTSQERRVRSQKPPRGKDDLLAGDAGLLEVIVAVNALGKRMSEQERATDGILTTLKGINETMRMVNDTSGTTKEAITTIQGRLENTEDALKEVTSTLEATERALKRHTDVALAQTRILTSHESKFDKMEVDKKKKIVIIEGVKEDSMEPLEAMAKWLFNDIGVNWGIEQVESLVRVGPTPRPNQDKQDGAQRNPRPRPVKLTFNKLNVKTDMMKSLKNLKGKRLWSGVSIGDDLDDKERREFLDLRSIYFLAKDLGLDARLRQRAVIIDKKSYTYSMLDKLPSPELTLEKATTAYSDDGVLFRSNHNRFSNLYPCEIEYEGAQFNSVEQAFQFEKARICGDKKAQERVMALSCPYAIMSEGKKVKDTAKWAKVTEQALYKLNCIKFTPEDMRDHLQSTKDLYMYEASFHPVWGAGYHLGQTELCTQKNLIGENLHGRILEKIRKEQRKEMAQNNEEEAEDDKSQNENDEENNE